MFGRSGQHSPTFGRRHTRESKKKISDVHKGKIIPISVREKMRRSHEGLHKGPDNPFYGKKHSEQSRERMSRSAKGRKLSPEHKERLRQAAIRRWEKWRFENG